VEFSQNMLSVCGPHTLRDAPVSNLNLILSSEAWVRIPPLPQCFIL